MNDRFLRTDKAVPVTGCRGADDLPAFNNVCCVFAIVPTDYASCRLVAERHPWRHRRREPCLIPQNSRFRSRAKLATKSVSQNGQRKRLAKRDKNAIKIANYSSLIGISSLKFFILSETHNTGLHGGDPIRKRRNYT